MGGFAISAEINAVPLGPRGSPDWLRLIDDVADGRWTSPTTGRCAPISKSRSIEIAETLEGREADLIAAVAPTESLALVADANTWDALGHRVRGALSRARRDGREVILEGRPHADLRSAAALAEKLSGVEHVIAVGSGTINDLVKYVTAGDGRSCSVFGTAPSMDGYVSSTASMGLDSGLKVSRPAQAPAGVFLDLGVMAAAPLQNRAAGFGDLICSSVARIDWWLSHRLLGTEFRVEPYEISSENDLAVVQHAEGVRSGDLEAIGYQVRGLVLSGLAIGFTGVSNHGSMGEHQISHYIDCFAGTRHPGTLHGEQVGVASLSMARIQNWFLAQETPPRLQATLVDEADMARRMGPEIAAECAAEYSKKALDPERADRLSEKLADIWRGLRRVCLVIAVDVETMRAQLHSAGGATSAAELGVPVDFYREAVRYGHEMRNRFSFADLACDAGLLDDFAAAET